MSEAIPIVILTLAAPSLTATTSFAVIPPENRTIQAKLGWTKSPVMGSQAFVAWVQSKSGIATDHREIVQGDDCYRLRGPGVHYNSHFDPEMARLRADNVIVWMNLYKFQLVG